MTTATATHTCKDCGVEISPKALRCRSCLSVWKRSPEGRAEASEKLEESHYKRRLAMGALPVIGSYIDRCPRPNCGARLFKERDADFGQCLMHGTIYLGVPMPELSHEAPAPRLAE